MVIILGGLIAVGVAAAQFFGFPIPQLFWTLLWIVAGVSLLILVVKFLLSLGGSE
jgi:hypothetical protein